MTDEETIRSLNRQLAAMSKECDDLRARITISDIHGDMPTRAELLKEIATLDETADRYCRERC